MGNKNPRRRLMAGAAILVSIFLMAAASPAHHPLIFSTRRAVGGGAAERTCVSMDSMRGCTKASPRASVRALRLARGGALTLAKPRPAAVRSPMDSSAPAPEKSGELTKGEVAEADGATEAAEAAEESAWVLRQLSLRSQRLAALSSSLVEAGFALPQLARKGPAPKVRVGWDCVVAPGDDDNDEDDDDDEGNDDEDEDDGEKEAGEGGGKQSAKHRSRGAPHSGAADVTVVPCLIMGEVAAGGKAVAPSGSGKWVGLWELNKMRRLEPTKVGGLWYDRFELDWASLGASAGPAGIALGFLLDHMWGLRVFVGVVAATVVVALRLPLAFVVTKVLTSEALWLRYLAWSRLIYAPLAAKLYFIGVLWRSVLLRGWLAAEASVRARLVEAECDLIEFAMAPNRPLSALNAGNLDPTPSEARGH